MLWSISDLAQQNLMAIPNYVRLVVLLFLALFNLMLTAADQGRCEQSRGEVGQMGIKHRAMPRHSFRNFTLTKAYDCHLKCFEEKCRCQAYQMWRNHCELLDEDRLSAPDDFVNEDGYTYFDMNREYVNQVSENKACLEEPCSNQCCDQSPCANGGVCTELCDDAKHKFNCTCPTEYSGRFCQQRRATSCKEQLEKYKRSQSDVHNLFDPTTNSMNEVFCDFTSENGFVWTLIESFSLANKNKFADKAFYKDYPVNQEAFTWNEFRLSRSRMNAIASRSSYVRATCSFNTGGLNYTDYLKAALSDIDVMNLKFDGCKRYEYINVRGYSCSSCTAHFVQTDNWHAHFDSFYGSNKGCQLTSPLAGAVKLSRGEDDFGWYQTVNPVHRCSSTENSTTQWWFGEPARY